MPSLAREAPGIGLARYNRVGMERAVQTYRELEVVPIPQAIPELGIQAGHQGTVAYVYEPGRFVSVEVSRRDGETIAFVDLDLHPEPHVIGYLDERD